MFTTEAAKILIYADHIILVSTHTLLKVGSLSTDVILPFLVNGKNVFNLS